MLRCFGALASAYEYTAATASRPSRSLSNLCQYRSLLSPMPQLPSIRLSLPLTRLRNLTLAFVL